jgi:predicted HD superfamily hydrolase involved in NAD metabolism
MLMMANDSGIIFDNETLGSTDLLHGAIGAYISEKEIGIGDTEILDAIRYHTTGRPDMTVLDKLIYLADFIEPGRSFPGVDEIRKLSMIDLNEAVIAALESTIEHLNRSGKKVHSSTVESRDYLIMEKNLEI